MPCLYAHFFVFALMWQSNCTADFMSTVSIPMIDYVFPVADTFPGINWASCCMSHKHYFTVLFLVTATLAIPYTRCKLLLRLQLHSPFHARAGTTELTRVTRTHLLYTWLRNAGSVCVVTELLTRTNAFFGAIVNKYTIYVVKSSSHVTHCRVSPFRIPNIKYQHGKRTGLQVQTLKKL